jgi:hypothetical protein
VQWPSDVKMAALFLHSAAILIVQSRETVLDLAIRP